MKVLGYSNAPPDQVNDSLRCLNKTANFHSETDKCMHIYGRFSLYTLNLTELELFNLILSARSSIKTIIESSEKSLYVHPSIISVSCLDPNFRYISGASVSKSSSRSKHINLVYILTPFFFTLIFIFILCRYKFKRNKLSERYCTKKSQNLQDQARYTKYDMSPISGPDRRLKLNNQVLDNYNVINTPLVDNSTLYFLDDERISSLENFYNQIDLVDNMSVYKTESPFRTSSMRSPTSLNGMRMSSEIITPQFKQLLLPDQNRKESNEN